MSVGLGILLFFSVFILYILIIPVTIKIDTYDNIYYVRMQGIWGFKLQKKNDIWKARFSLLFLKFKPDVFKKKKDKEQSTEVESKPKKIRKKRHGKIRILKLFFRILKTFNIRKIESDLDTGDFPLNAQLIPLFYSMNRRNVTLSVNFNGINNLYLVVYTRLYKVIYQIIKNLMFNK